MPRRRKTIMEKEIKTKAFVRAAAIFVLMFLLICVSAFVKYRAYGSFNDNGSDYSLILALAGSGVCVLLLLVSLFTYFVYSRQTMIEKTKELAAICTAVVLSCVVCIGISALGLFYMPMALAAFVLVPLSARRDVFIANIVTNLIVSVILLFESIMGSKVEAIPVLAMMIIGIFTGSIVAYTMSDVVRRVVYVIRGIAIGLTTIALLFISSLIVNTFYFVDEIGFLCIPSFGQVLVGLLLQPVFESVFNILTNTKLTELTDHNAPLIKMLINDALGTFNHSITVASFAEVCALRIGENPYLAKACAYYHDVGKAKNPTFFSENQSGYNPHDELLPEVSAKILRAHTTDGYELCIKHRIPEEVASVTLQHHGTLPMAVFYAKAKKLTDGDVDIKEYSYHGETPVTKIAAIIMICDACEAALRARNKPTGAEVDAIVGGIISDRIARRQFDNCDITLRDLNIIKHTIIGLYGGLYHERVQYPSGKADGND